MDKRSVGEVDTNVKSVVCGVVCGVLFRSGLGVRGAWPWLKQGARDYVVCCCRVKRGNSLSSSSFCKTGREWELFSVSEVTCPMNLLGIAGEGVHAGTVGRSRRRR